MGWTLVTWSEFQHVSSLLSNINFFPNCFTSRFSTELTLKATEPLMKPTVPHFPVSRHKFLRQDATFPPRQESKVKHIRWFLVRKQLTCHSPSLNLAANQRGRHDFFYFDQTVVKRGAALFFFTTLMLLHFIAPRGSSRDAENTPMAKTSEEESSFQYIKANIFVRFFNRGKCLTFQNYFLHFNILQHVALCNNCVVA